MKKNKPRATEKQRREPLLRTLLQVLFPVYGVIIISLYMRKNNLEIGRLGEMIAGYFTPILPASLGMDVGAGNLLSGIYSILVAVALVVAVFGIGRLCLKAVPGLKMKTETENILLAVGTGSFLMVILLFLLGIASMLRPLPVLLIGVAGIIAAFMFNDTDFGRLKEEISPGGLPLLTKIALGAGAMLLLIVLSASLVPEIFYDSLVYHASVAHWYQLVHSLTPPVSETIHFFVPGYARLLYSVMFIFSDVVSAKVLHFLFVVLTASVIFAFGNSKYGRTAGIFAALAFISIPSIGIVGVRSVMEAFLCFFEFLAFVTALQYIETGERKWLGVSGLLLGTAIGCKYLSIMSWAAIGLALLAYVIASKRPVKDIVKDAFLWNGAILAAAGFWVAYNVYYTGNPVYPALWQHIGHLKAKAFNAVGEIGKTITISDVITSPWNISMGLKEESFAGVMFLMLLPLLLFTKWYRSSLKYVVIYAVGYWLIWMNIAPYFYFRYYLPAMPAVCLLVGYAAGEFNGKIMRLFFLAVMIINMAYVSSLLKAIYFPVDYLTGNISKDEYLSTNLQTYPNPCYPAFDWINKNTPKDAKVLLQGEERSLYLERQYVPISISDNNYLVLLVQKSNSIDDIAQRLRQDGITHILLNVPEARRLKPFDILNFEPREFGMFLGFWDRYIREAHRDIADLMLLQRGIFSLRRQQPQWWQQYASDEGNYIYVYELLSDEAAARPHSVPRNFFKEPSFYPDSRWKMLEPLVR